MPMHATGDFHPPWGPFCTPPFLFGGRPPQSNCPPGTVRLLDQTLEGKSGKSGISRLAPPSPRARLHSLPPILRIPDPPPVPSCSKAPRGLFVLARETRIFTGTSISPSPSLRQPPDRYAIRAGRNLPDKEFRYLRQLCCHPAPKGAGRAGHFCRPLH